MAYKINESCIGCGICKKNCPTLAITGETKKKYIINEKRCVDCGVCGRVCPTGAVIGTDGSPVYKQPKEKWQVPSIKACECSACGVCVDICIFDCIAISKPKFKGDKDVFAQLALKESCVGCGLCGKSCPINAIAMVGRCKDEPT